MHGVAALIYDFKISEIKGKLTYGSTSTSPLCFCESMLNKKGKSPCFWSRVEPVYKRDFFADICKGLNKNHLDSCISKDTSWISRLLFKKVHAYDILTV